MSGDTYEREYGLAALWLNSRRVPLQIDGKHISLIDRIVWLQKQHELELHAMTVARDSACEIAMLSDYVRCVPHRVAHIAELRKVGAK